MVDGVAQVNVYGAAKYAVRIQLDPKAMATRAIGIDEVADGVAAGNVNLPTGICGVRTGPTPCKRTASCGARPSSGRSS